MMSSPTVQTAIEELKSDDHNQVLEALHTLTILLSSTPPPPSSVTAASDASRDHPSSTSLIEEDIVALQKYVIDSCLHRYKSCYGEHATAAKRKADEDESYDEGMRRVLETEDKKQRIIELAYSTSSKLFARRDTMRKWFEGDLEIAQFLTNGFQDKYEIVRKLVAQQVGRLAVHDTQYWLQREELVHMLVDTIADESLSVVNETQRFLVLYAKKYTEAFFGSSSTILQRLRENAQLSHQVKIRVCELLVNIAATSEQASTLFHESSILSEIVGTLDISDPLTLLNIVEIIRSVGATEQGVIALRDTGMLKNVITVLQESHKKDDFMVRDFVLEAVGTFCEHCQHAFDSNQLRSCYEMIQSMILDRNHQAVALSALGSIAGGSDTALRLLLRDPTLLKDYLNFFVSDSESDDAARAGRHSIGHLLSSRLVSTNVCEHFYLAMQQLVLESTHDRKNVVTRSMELLKTPFPDDRFPLYHILNGLCHHVWGLRTILTKSPLFIDFIIDRTTDKTRQGMEWKFSIVDSMLKTATTFADQHPQLSRQQPLLTSTQRHKLTFFTRRGPYYQASEARVQMATEST